MASFFKDSSIVCSEAHDTPQPGTPLLRWPGGYSVPVASRHHLDCLHQHGPLLRVNLVPSAPGQSRPHCSGSATWSATFSANLSMDSPVHAMAGTCARRRNSFECGAHGAIVLRQGHGSRRGGSCPLQPRKMPTNAAFPAHNQCYPPIQSLGIQYHVS